MPDLPYIPATADEHWDINRNPAHGPDTRLVDGKLFIRAYILGGSSVWVRVPTLEPDAP